MFNKREVLEGLKLNLILFIVVLVATYIFLSILNGISVYSNEVYREEVETIDITVKEGDTIWQIAEKYKDDLEDTRKLVYEISSYNELSKGYIIPGDIIKIPIGYNKD